DVELPGAHDAIDGADAVKSVTLVDQLPLGRTSRGNAATYTKAWDTIRALYAREPEAIAHSLGPAAFSFNVEGGRCESCNGEGYETVEMQFLADVRLVCPSCRGKRFQERVLAVRHRGVSVADLLETTVDRALELFASEPAVQRALGPVARLGLGYLTLGQPLTTLSGGEAQRIKLARALAERHEGALFVLDEPSAGLHADEVLKLVGALDLIVDAGGSVVIVEHDLDLVSRADWLLDLGPGAGAHGGRLVGEGTPRELERLETRTGQALRERNESGTPAEKARGSATNGGKRTNGSARSNGSAKQNGRAKPNGDARSTGDARANGSAPEAVLTVTRAREHNLRDVSVKIPHGALTIVTGPSGSGKSTLAFDVVFAEGQRRFLETLTPYARQFLPTMPRPDVDAVTGVPPAIALEQRTARAGASSTVATVTEVAHYLRLLYAKVAVPHCPDHGEPIAKTSPEAVAAAVRRVRGQRALCAPVVKARKGTYLDVFTAARRAGILQAYCDGTLVSTDDPPKLKKQLEHTIDLLISGPMNPALFADAALEQALTWGEGELKLRSPSGEEELFSTTSACPRCGFSVPTLDPRWFSFNTKQGRCADCEGAGVVYEEARRKKNQPVMVLESICSTCDGSRLAPIPRAVRLFGERYHELTHRSVTSTLERMTAWRFSGDAARLAEA
ncbi:MAG TPA: excinuclease ABC subunit A, partial [Polyangiaceae bacterium]|nr:excinuclease ABC subunit A [Polyangiaceae bacterium]